MLLNSCIISFPVSWLVRSLRNDRNSWVILYTWLLKFSSNVSTIWWTSTENTHIFTFCAHLERSVNSPFSQTCLSSIFKSCSFQTQPSCQTISHSLWISVNPGHFSFHTKLTTRSTAWSSSHWACIHSIVLQGSSIVVIYAAYAHF